MTLVYFAYQIFHHYPWYYSTIVLLDELIILYCLFEFTTRNILLLSVLLVKFFALICHMKQLNRILSKAIANYRKRLITQLEFINKVHYFQHEHIYLIGIRLNKDARFWSNVVTSFLMTNFPINVYILTFVSYKIFRWDKMDDNLLVIMIVLSIQMSSLFGGIYPAAYLCELFHRCNINMNPVQIELPGGIYQLTMLKYKHMVHHEIINSENRITIDIGPFGQVTIKKMFEVSIVLKKESFKTRF